jgi:SAM-dependent methyltransferase
MNHTRMPESTVRGRIRNFILDHITLIQGHVLEVGSLLPRTEEGFAWWAYNRNLVHKDHPWTGLDFQEGPNVDVVADIEKRTQFDNDNFHTVICSEVMEHLYRPADALKEMHRVLKKDGWIIITTLFAFPVHGYPDDYWRFTPSCMKRLLEDAGFRDIKVETGGVINFQLDNAGEGGIASMDAPIHIFAVARK